MPAKFDVNSIKELFFPFTFSLIILIITGLIDVLFSLLDYLINRGLGIQIVLQILFFKVPSVILVFIPICGVFSVVLVLFRMIRDNECLILWTVGLSHSRLLKPFLVFGILLTFISIILSAYVVPLSNFKANTLIQQLILKETLPAINEHTFFRDVGNRVFYIEKINHHLNEMKGVMIYELNDALPRVLIAERAQWNGNEWTLYNGTLHRFLKNGYLEFESRFEQMMIRVKYQLEGRYNKIKQAREMSSAELSQEIHVAEKAGLDVNALKTELYLKTAVPFTCLIFTIWGSLLLFLFVRTGRDIWGLVWAVIWMVVVVMTYFFISAFLRALGVGGKMSPFLGAWLPVILFSLGGLILWYRVRKL